MRPHPGSLAVAVCLMVVSLAGCEGSSPSGTRDAHLAAGDAHFTEGRFPQATVEYQKAVTADPRSADARQRLAESYVRVGMAPFALQEYAKAAELAPDRADLQFQTAALMHEGQQFAQAEAFARRGIARAPDNPAGYLLLGNAIAASVRAPDQRNGSPAAGTVTDADRTARAADAEASYKEALRLEPRAPVPFVALGRLYEIVGRRPDAEASYKRALAIAPGDVAANRALAALYLATDRVRDAEAPLKAIAESINAPDGFLDLADYYIGQGRLAEARAVLEPLKARLTTFIGARLRLAALEFQDGHRQAAHGLVDEVLEQQPTNAKASLLKARLLRADGRIDAAIPYARTAVDAEPGSVVARRELASLYASRHNRDEAIRVLSGVPADEPDGAEAHADLARLHLARHDAARAVSAAKLAVAAAPALPVARSLLARALVAVGDPAGAESALRLEEDRGREDADLLLARGELERARRAPERARRSLSRARALAPDDLDVMAALVRLELDERRFAAARSLLASRGPEGAPQMALLSAEIEEAAGQSADAERALRRIVTDDPVDADAWLALAKLLRLAGRLTEAQQAAEQAVRDQPAWAEATLALGDILVQRGDRGAARARYEALLSVDPDAAEVRRRLGR